MFGNSPRGADAGGARLGCGVGRLRQAADGEKRSLQDLEKPEDQMTSKFKGFMVHVLVWDYNKIWYIAQMFKVWSSRKRQISKRALQGH